MGDSELTFAILAALAFHIGLASAPDAPLSAAQRAFAAEQAVCPLPPADRRDQLVVVRMSGGDAVSTVAVAGLDKSTSYGEIAIGPGPGRMQLMIESNEPIVIRFTGRVDRLSKVVMVGRAGAGVIGVPRTKVHFTIGRKCYLHRAPQYLIVQTGRKADLFEEMNALHKGWTDGKVFRHAEAVEAEDRGRQTRLEAKLDDFYPSGVVALDPLMIVASSKPQPYSLLPNIAGAVQLEREGALVEMSRPEIEAWQEKARLLYGEWLIGVMTIRGDAYRVTRPIQSPPGLCGGHLLHLFVPAKEFIRGDPCHSFIFTMEGRILRPSNYADYPGCGSPVFVEQVRPQAPGPLALRSIHCSVKTGPGSANLAIASPDAKYMAFLPGQSLRIQEIADQPSEPRSLPAGADLPNFGVVQTNRWLAHSSGMWATMSLSQTEHRRGPFRPVIVHRDGTIEEFPEFRHPHGPAIGLQWLSADGRAIVRFQPADPFDRVAKRIIPSTWGIVDARTGALLDDFDEADFGRLKLSDPRLDRFFPNKTLGVVRADGRAHVLMDFGPWVSWVQGEEPRVIDALPEATAGFMAADGKTVLLLMPNLPGEDNRTHIYICDGDGDDDDGGGRHGPCPKREPKEGTWASLHDADSGRMLWALRWTFDRQDQLTKVALSDDGRFLLIGLVSRTSRHKALIGVVSMKDGKLIQTFVPPNQHYSMGFTADSKTAWITSFRGTTLYDVR
jgi:hypothetical protein